MRRYTTVLFDLDGTLLNTLEDIRDSLNAVLRENGFPERSPEEVRHFLGNGSARLLERSLPQGRETENFDGLLRTYNERYLAHNMDKTVPYEGIMDMLRTLSAREYKLAVVSNKPDANVRALVRHFFGGLISVSIGDAPGRKRKPDPDSVNAALRELWSEPWEAVYVGDSEVDLATAKAAGIPCISAAWGFRTAETLREAGAKRIIPTPGELLQLV